ncbi:MAG: RagB/SusD family nutrient uptake outer membrane protein [Agriterribacter sp.]
MKNKILLVVISAFFLFSCSKDFLNLTPPTSLSSVSFFQDRNQFMQALNAAYVPLRDVAIVGVYEDEMRSDNTFFTIYQANRGFEPHREAYPQFINNAQSSAIPNSPGSRWTADYSGISRVNTILNQLTDNSFLSQGAKDTLMGEASFLRAFYYFDLVTHYGGVPLHLEQIENAEESFKARNSVDEIYTQIKADLSTAIPLLPTVTSFPQTGRASKGAAKMLLAYVYMTQPVRDYPKAEQELRDITQMNYGLLDDYASVFDPANKNHRESIFDVQYMSDLVSGQQSQFAWVFMPKATNTQVIMGFDGGRMNIFSGWNVPTDEMVESYEEGDERLPASVAVVEGTISGVEDFTISSLKSPVGYTPTPGAAFRYMVKKYFHPPYSVSFNTPDNFPIFRYSGALLLLAECLAEQGREPEALPYLNQVRDRAGLEDLDVATKDNIADEMRHELAFENHRWLDLIRTGKAIEKTTAKGTRLKAIYGWILPAAFNVTQEKLIYPIPARELQINKELTQNPGYE